MKIELKEIKFSNEGNFLPLETGSHVVLVSSVKKLDDGRLLVNMSKKVDGKTYQATFSQSLFNKLGESLIEQAVTSLSIILKEYVVSDGHDVYLKRNDEFFTLDDVVGKSLTIYVFNDGVYANVYASESSYKALLAKKPVLAVDVKSIASKSKTRTKKTSE